MARAIKHYEEMRDSFIVRDNPKAPDVVTETDNEGDWNEEDETTE